MRLYPGQYLANETQHEQPVMVCGKDNCGESQHFYPTTREFMGFFGPSKKERFVRREAQSLAIYLKNNAAKYGSEAYANCQVARVLPAEIDKPLAWFFWTLVYAYHVAKECLQASDAFDQQTAQMLFRGFVDIDNQYFKSIPHEPYDEVFTYVSTATTFIKAARYQPNNDPVIPFLLHVLKAIPGQFREEDRFILVLHLSEAMKGFPEVGSVIAKNG